MRHFPPSFSKFIFLIHFLMWFPELSSQICIQPTRLHSAENWFARQIFHFKVLSDSTILDWDSSCILVSASQIDVLCPREIRTLWPVYSHKAGQWIKIKCDFSSCFVWNIHKRIDASSSSLTKYPSLRQSKDRKCEECLSRQNLAGQSWI